MIGTSENVRISVQREKPLVPGSLMSTKAVMPTGDIEKDMREIKLYFKNFKGKNPENFDLGNI